ncbi:MAG: hypothetical protein H5U36_09285, partial [Candidatus Caldatribacterium sp.]|nr:hypothetical protein [Candidatus Caldatribacterium sp.]
MPSKKLSSRERVMKAIMHEEPDRVPIDLGGSITTGIVAKTLAELRKYLGLDRRPVKIYDVFQMLGEVEMDVIDRFEVDVLPIEPLSLFFKIKRKDYKPWIFQGEEFLVPGDFRVEVDEEGNLLLREGGDPAKPIVARMPKDGYYFEDLSFIHFAEDFKPPSLEEMRRKRERILTDEDLEFMSLRAELLRKTTDKALLLGCWPNVGLSPVGSLPNFLILLAQDRGYVKELMHLREEETIENLKLLWDALGNNIDIVVIDGFDFGTQQGEMISP